METQRTTSESSSDTTSTPTIREDGSSVGSSEEDEETLPEGVTYPLNSKKVVVAQLRRLAEMLGLSSEGTSARIGYSETSYRRKVSGTGP